MKIKMNIKRMVVGLMTVSICCGCADLTILKFFII